MRQMNRTGLFAMLLLFASTAGAQSFLRVGPRSVGMGGAFVAVADDATATYWNPAALFFNNETGATFVYGFGVNDRQDFIKNIEKASGLNLQLDNPQLFLSEAQKALELVGAFLDEGTGADGFSGYGLFSTRAGLGFSITDQYWASGYPIPDLEHLSLDPGSPDSIADNESSVALQAVRAREYVLTISHTLGDPGISGGVNLKYIRGSTYATTLGVFDLADFSPRDFLDRATDDKQGSDSAFGMDMGVLVRPAPRFRLGLVARNLAEPEFKFEDGSKMKIKREIRAGAALYPQAALALSVDLDLTKNKPGIAGVTDRQLAVGLEKWVANRGFAFRGGYTRHIGEKNPDTDLSGGFGFRKGSLQGDFGICFAPGSKDISAAFAVGIVQRPRMPQR